METGRHGEAAALRFLKRRGWLPLAVNWSASSGGEIDIVARRRGVLAIIEVKTRSDPAALVEPVSLEQRRRIARGAAAFIRRHPDLEDLRLRYDLVTVDRSRLPSRITHRPDAFAPPPPRRG